MNSGRNDRYCSSRGRGRRLSCRALHRKARPGRGI